MLPLKKYRTDRHGKRKFADIDRDLLFAVCNLNRSPVYRKTNHRCTQKMSNNIFFRRLTTRLTIFYSFYQQGSSY